jgi:hypothetical protein
MNTSEAMFRESITKPAKLVGKVFICHGHAFQARGWPDIFVALPQWRGWIELKVKAPVEPHQKQMIRNLREMRCPAYILRYRPKVGGVCIMDDEERELGFYEGWDLSFGMTEAARQVQELMSMLADTDPWYYVAGVKKRREMGL